MTLQQLVSFCQVVDSGFSVSKAAAALMTTQPGVSKMVLGLEQQLGAALFIRRGNRLEGLTDAGREALVLSRRMLHDADTLATLGESMKRADSGVLRLGTTHFHARYPLLETLTQFSTRYPGVSLVLTQGSPAQIIKWLEEHSIDVGISTKPPHVSSNIALLDAYEVERCLIVPVGHPLLLERKLSLTVLARYPLIAYETSFSTGQSLHRAFEAKNITPAIVMRATDASVVKAYVRAGLGIAVIQKMAVQPAEDQVEIIDVGHLFPASPATIGIRKDWTLRGYTASLISMINPELTLDAIQAHLR